MEKFALYHVQLLKNILSKHRARNSKFSLRKFAQDLGISPTMLSQILSNQKGLSESMATNIAEKLNLTSAEKEVFLLSTRSAHSRSSMVKLESILELAEINKRTQKPRKNTSGPNEILSDASRFVVESMEVQQLVAFTEVHAVYRYFSKNEEIQFRILYILKNKISEKIVNDFIQITFNEKTRQGATVYFLKKDNGRFKTYFNNSFDGKHRVTGLVAENQNTEIVFDSNFLPTIPLIRFLVLDTNKHVVGKMQYTENEFSVTGTLVDLDHPDHPLDSNYQLRLFRRTKD